MPDFQAALTLVLKSEGGRSDNPKDPGGRTNEGITQIVYDAWRRAHGQGMRTVYLIRPDEVSAIYRAQYADAVHFDDLPSGLGYAVFDAAVNSGPARAAEWLQKAIGAKVDCHIGVLTIEAAAQCDRPAAINELCDVRLAFLRELPTWGEFKVGWTNRIAEVRAAASQMAGPSGPVARVATAEPRLKPPSVPLALAADRSVTLPSVITPAPKPQRSALLRLWAALIRKAA